MHGQGQHRLRLIRRHHEWRHSRRAKQGRRRFHGVQYGSGGRWKGCTRFGDIQAIQRDGPRVDGGEVEQQREIRVFEDGEKGVVEIWEQLSGSDLGKTRQNLRGSS